MAPAQFCRHCLQNWVQRIKLSHLIDIAHSEAITVSFRQISRKPFQSLRPHSFLLQTTYYLHFCRSSFLRRPLSLLIYHSINCSTHFFLLTANKLSFHTISLFIKLFSFLSSFSALDLVLNLPHNRTVSAISSLIRKA